VKPRDLQRRVQVAAIFAQRCFKPFFYYASAATVYQPQDAAVTAVLMTAVIAIIKIQLKALGFSPAMSALGGPFSPNDLYKSGP